MTRKKQEMHDFMQIGHFWNMEIKLTSSIERRTSADTSVGCLKE